MTSFLEVNGLTKSFGAHVLFRNVSFGIAQGDKVGLIARNGSGKSTLLNMLAGKEDYDSGEIVYRKDLRVGYLEQSPVFPTESTVLQVCASHADELKSKQILGKLEITDYNQKVRELSGGQLKRVALARVRLTEPELIILDEPTNHLDLDMIEWLEDYLNRANISILMVTHDRYFLDRVCKEIIEIDNLQIYSYRGNYEYYLEKREERINASNAEATHAANLLRKELDWMRRMPQARGGKAKYRIDAYYELEKKAHPVKDTSSLNLDVKASYIGSKIFNAEHVSKRFGDLKITDDFNYIFARYEKLGIVGNNGVGKSTFIKMLLGIVKPDSGHFDIGETVRFGYYSQEGLQFDENAKVIDIMQDIAEYVTLGNGDKLSVSQFLTYFLFSPDKQHDYVSKLSGGERRRLYLCTVLMHNPNFLILDEPTNDLDIITLNVLEEYLAGFHGCVIVVSHDRYFMDKVVDHLLVFHGQAEIQDFPGNYTQYRDYREAKELLARREKENVEKPKESTPKQPVRNDPEGKRKLTFKERKEYEALEKEIDDLEKEKAELETLLNSGTLDPQALTDKSKRYAEVLQLIDDKSTRWLELSEFA